MSLNLVEMWSSHRGGGITGIVCARLLTGMWTRKLKDHTFKVHLFPFFRVPVKVTGVDEALFR